MFNENSLEEKLMPDFSSNVETLKQELEKLLICPIMKTRLVNPHVIQIDVEGEKRVLTISGQALQNLPNEFQANKVGYRSLQYNGSLYNVQPCFDRIMGGLLSLLDENPDEETFKLRLIEILTCPISNVLLISPVVTSTGRTYSETALDEWQKYKKMRCDALSDPVTFMYEHALALELLRVCQKHYPQEFNLELDSSEEGVSELDAEAASERLLRARHFNTDEEQRASDEETSTWIMGGTMFAAGEAGTVMGLSWLCGGCNNHALAAKLAIGGGVGCFIGMGFVVLGYHCFVPPQRRVEHCASLSRCSHTFYNACACVRPAVPVAEIRMDR